MSETGVVKFACEHLRRPLPMFAGFEELKRCRQALRGRGLLGVNENGVGFGNISLREGLTSEFYITGSGTGGKAEIGLDDCSKVVACDFAANWLRCEGNTIASAESLTHAAVYDCAPQAGAVVHVHSAELWARWVDRLPTTSVAVAYGTPAMANEVKRLFASTDLHAQKIFVMAGHKDGVIAFGGDLEEATEVLVHRSADD